METKEIKITAPEGYEIDKENSTFEKIVFKKKKAERWRDDETADIDGYYILTKSEIGIFFGENNRENYNVFATEKQAKSALAMARISQIMANDERFGGVFTDEEWKNDQIKKYIIGREKDKNFTSCYYNTYCFLAFHTAEQRDLFLKENEDLVRDYLMID